MTSDIVTDKRTRAAEDLRRRAFALRQQLVPASSVDFCLTLAAACREAGRAALEAAQELYAESYNVGGLSSSDRDDMRRASVRLGKVAEAYYGGPKPLDGARIWLARLHHWWHEQDRDGQPAPDAWWRNGSDAEIAAIEHECTRGVQKDRDHDEPFYWGLAPALADWARRQLRWMDDEVADLFALEMINGRPRGKDDKTLVSGHRQHPEWPPTPETWALRLNDYRNRRWTPILDDEGEVRVDPLDTYAPSADAVAAELDDENVRSAWRLVHGATLERIPKHRAAVERFGPADAELIASTLNSVLRPKARNLGSDAKKQKSRARAAYWEAFGPSAGFPSTNALVEALLADPSHAPFWREAGLAYGEEAWQAMEAMLAAPLESPQDAQQHRWLKRRRNDFVQWVIVLAWAAAIEIPRHEKEVTV